MRKNGFTLVELIAVITLLSMIVLVSVPVIINTINRMKEKEFNEFKQVVENAAELYLVRNMDLYPELNEIGDSIDLDASVLVNEGYLKHDLTDPMDDNNVSKYKVVITIGQNEVIEYQTVERKTFRELVTKTKDVPNINACALSGKCEPGTKFAIEVNDEQVYNFYVISDTGEEVTLIMDRNLGEKLVWISKEDYIAAGGTESVYGTYGSTSLGPITLLNYLNSETETWTNIPAIESYTYDNNLNGTTNTYGYQKLVITNGQGVLTSRDGAITTTLAGTSRARILTEEEVIVLKTTNSNITPTWLYTNLSSSNTTEQPIGYWLLTATAYNINRVRYMRYSGEISDLHSVVDGTLRSARPVITVSRSL